MQSGAFQRLIWCKSEHEMTENAVQDDADCKTTPFKTLSKSTKITTKNALKQPFISYLFTLKRAIFWLSFLTKSTSIYMSYLNYIYKKMELLLLLKATVPYIIFIFLQLLY